MSCPRTVGTLCLVVVCVAFGFFRCCNAEEAAKETAIKPGDRVRVVNGPAPVKDGAKTITTVETGTELDAIKVQGDWVQVKVSTESGPYWAWIKASKHLQKVSAPSKEKTPGVKGVLSEKGGQKQDPARPGSVPAKGSGEQGAWNHDIEAFKQALAKCDTVEAQAAFEGKEVTWRVTYMDVLDFGEEGQVIQIKEGSSWPPIKVANGHVAISVYAAISRNDVPNWRKLKPGTQVLLRATIRKSRWEGSTTSVRIDDLVTGRSYQGVEAKAITVMLRDTVQLGMPLK